MEAIIPDSFVFPPAFIFTTVRIVAPAPGIPPKTEAIAFPIPCPISSLLGLCLVFVILSAITDVNKESIAPKKARDTAASMYGDISASLNEVKIAVLNSGNPKGISGIG